MSMLHPNEESGSGGYELMRDGDDYAQMPAESRFANRHGRAKEDDSVMHQQNLRDLLQHEQEERRRAEDECRREKEERANERAAMQELREELRRSREECIAMQEQLRRVDNRKDVATTADAAVAL
jgi:hypothetical protein